MKIPQAGADLPRDYPLFDRDDGSRFVRLPDGRVLEVDWEQIHQMACDGSLLEQTEDAQQFVRYLCGEAED